MNSPCEGGCLARQENCWGRCHPILCVNVARDPEYVNAVRAMGEHPPCGEIKADWHKLLGIAKGKLKVRPWTGPTIRVGLASPDLQIGGVGAWMLDLIRATSSAPFEWVGIAVKDRRATYAPVVERFERLLPVRWGDKAIAALGSSVDLLVAWGLADVHDLLEQSGCRTLLVSHGVCEWTESVLRDAKRATACAAVVAAAAEKFPAGERGRVRVIRNMATLQPPNWTRQQALAAWGVPQGKKVLGYLGRISTEKYPEAVVKAIAALPDEWVGVLVGPWGSYLDKAVAESGIGHRIFRPGPVDSASDALVAFDALMLASDADAHSIALTEAWLAGIPVVATAIGITADFPELVRVVPRRASGAALRDAILADQDDPGGTIHRTERARRFAETELSPEIFAKEWRSYLAEIVESTAAGYDAGTPIVITPEPPKPYVSPLAHLSDEQLAEVRDCPRKKQRTGCCSGVLNYCGAGYFGGEKGVVQTAQCAQCVTEGWDRG